MNLISRSLFPMATLEFRKFNFAWRTCKWTLLFVGDNFNYYLFEIPYGKANFHYTISLRTCFIHPLTLDDVKVLIIVEFVRTA